MYVPRHFRQDDATALAALIRENSFGVLVSTADGRPVATHAPFLYDEHEGKLLGHLARANSQWQHLAEGQEALAIFQGPHAYISPSWYLNPGVPTWNYAVVHVYGVATLVEEPARVQSIVESLTDEHERSIHPPWTRDYDTRMIGGIVGFELAITEIQGKYKLSQNRPAEDRPAVIARLRAQGTTNALAVAELMEDMEIQP